MYRARRILLGLLLILVTTQVSALTVTLETRIEGEPGRPVIIGKTNLPKGTSLFVSIGTELGRTVAQQNTVVGDGAFKVGPFFREGLAPLEVGRYMLEIGTPGAQFQPSEVKKIIGDEGINLKGPLVINRPVGNVVQYETRIVVGGAEGVKTQAKKQNSLIDEARVGVLSIQRQIDKGKVLLRSKPTDQAIGDQTIRIKEVTGKIISTYRHSIPECASMASAAWPFWYFGMVGVYNIGLARQLEYEKLRTTYEKEMEKCKQVLHQ